MSRKLVLNLLMLGCILLCFLVPHVVMLIKLRNGSSEDISKKQESISPKEAALLTGKNTYTADQKITLNYTIRTTYYRQGFFVRHKRDTISGVVEATNK